MTFGAVTGGSLDPARSLGPVVASDGGSEVEAPLKAQIGGAVAAVPIFYPI